MSNQALSMHAHNLQAISSFLQLMRETVCDSMTVQQLLTLVAVAQHPRGISQAELGLVAKLSRSGVSKNVADLSLRKMNKKRGPNFLRSRIDPENRTRRSILMTATGAEQFDAALGQSFGELTTTPIDPVEATVEATSELGRRDNRLTLFLYRLSSLFGFGYAH